MKKRITKIWGIGLILILIVALAMITAPVSAAGPSGPAGKSNVGHINLVEKDADWNIIEDGAWGKARYILNGSTLDVVLNAHDLTPGDWYYVELVDKGSDGTDWAPIVGGNPDTYSMFYGQADSDGDVHISFSWSVPIGAYVEVNMKNADWVALGDPSTYGNADNDWIYTGQGWDHVLYAADTIIVP